MHMYCSHLSSHSTVNSNFGSKENGDIRVQQVLNSSDWLAPAPFRSKHSTFGNLENMDTENVRGPKIMG